MERIFQEIKAERERQDAKFGNQERNVATWAAILSEESGEVSKEAVDYYCMLPEKNEKGEYVPVSDVTQYKRLANLRKELIQVAAVAVQVIQKLDAGGSKIYSTENNC